MQIVIDIEEKRFRDIQRISTVQLKGRTPTLEQVIAHGTPLPKGHGRLIDADELYGDFIDGTEGYDCQTWNRIEIGDIIEDAPTIIEADKKSESEESE